MKRFGVVKKISNPKCGIESLMQGMKGHPGYESGSRDVVDKAS